MIIDRTNGGFKVIGDMSEPVTMAYVDRPPPDLWYYATDIGDFPLSDLSDVDLIKAYRESWTIRCQDIHLFRAAAREEFHRRGLPFTRDMIPLDFLAA